MDGLERKQIEMGLIILKIGKYGEQIIDQLKKKVSNIKQISVFEKKEFNDKEREIFYRFWSYVDIKDNIEECWNWKGCTNKDGYGKFRCGINVISAHRFACMLKERIPHGFQSQHLCNNPKCCNPNHLKPGTRLENTEYMIKCTRQPKGESSGVAILTEDQVREIHRLYREGISKYTKQWQIIEPIAKKFGTTRRYINEKDGVTYIMNLNSQILVLLFGEITYG